MGIDQSDIDLARDLVAVLHLCAVAVERIEEGTRNPAALARDLRRVMVTAEALASQTHDAMVTARRELAA